MQELVRPSWGIDHEFRDHHVWQWGSGAVKMGPILVRRATDRQEDRAAAEQSAWQTAFQPAFDIVNLCALTFMELPFETMESADLKTTVTNIRTQS